MRVSAGRIYLGQIYLGVLVGKIRAARLGRRAERHTKTPPVDYAEVPMELFRGAFIVR
jgi:hypothetical protein